jgi:hypothetical protein
VCKTPASKHALTEIIRERMKDFSECPLGISIEIRKVQTSEGPGWTAVTSPEDSLAYIKCARIVGALTIELRRQYELSDD